MTAAALGVPATMLPTTLRSTTTILPTSPRLDPIRRFVRLPPPTSHLLVLQKWEGSVTAVEHGVFSAVLRDLTDPAHADERIDLPFDEVTEGDRGLIAVGAVFYWCIGYRDQADGQRERVSLIRFQRLPAWTRRELAEARAAAEKLAEQLDWR